MAASDDEARALIDAALATGAEQISIFAPNRSHDRKFTAMLSAHRTDREGPRSRSESISATGYGRTWIEALRDALRHVDTTPKVAQGKQRKAVGDASTQQLLAQANAPCAFCGHAVGSCTC